MEEHFLLDTINETASLLYQNKEKEGILEVGKLLKKFQNMIQSMTEKQICEVGEIALIMLKELLEAYTSQDMLGMADCLMQKAILFVQFYYQN